MMCGFSIRPDHYLTRVDFDDNLLKMRSILSGLSRYLNEKSEQLLAQGIAFDPQWDVDHACYRVEIMARYQELKEQLVQSQIFLGEAQVNGRPIATFKLREGISFGDGFVDLIELPAPKPGSLHKEGFEHFEVVCDADFSELKERFKNHKMSDGGAKKLFNRELEFSTDQITWKFHHHSLESVVRLEMNAPVWAAILKSRALEIFAEKNPLVVGTFPLGLEIENSDVDILVESDSYMKFSTTCRQAWGDHSEFLVRAANHQGLSSAICNFVVDGISFEIFAQNLPTVQQRAAKHYFVEERLLKYGGQKLKDKVMEYRRAGLKTEPAFAKALSLDGDPYEALAKLSSVGVAQLRKQIANLN